MEYIWWGIKKTSTKILWKVIWAEHLTILFMSSPLPDPYLFSFNLPGYLRIHCFQTLTHALDMRQRNPLTQLLSRNMPLFLLKTKLWAVVSVAAVFLAQEKDDDKVTWGILAVRQGSKLKYLNLQYPESFPFIIWNKVRVCGPEFSLLFWKFCSSLVWNAVWIS